MKYFLASAFFCLFAISVAAQSQSASENFFTSDPETAEIFYDAVSAGLSGRTWLAIPDGMLENDLIERAKKRGTELVTIPLRGASRESVEKFHAAVKTLGNTRLATAAYMRPEQFLAAWAAEDIKGMTAKLATLAVPATALPASVSSLPNGLVCIVNPSDVTDAAALKSALSRFRAIHGDASELFLFRQPNAPGGARSELFLRRAISVNGNNLGYLLYRAGSKDDAYTAFSLAHSIDPNNISPLLNLASVVREGIKPEQGEKIAAQLTALSRAGVGSWNLAETSGFVLKPEDFAPVKWYWAASGIPNAEYERNAAFTDSVTDPESRNFLLARLSMMAPPKTAAERMKTMLASEIFQSAPDGKFLLVCAHAHLTASDIARAEIALAAAETAGGADPKQLASIKAALLTASGKSDDAIAALEAARTADNAVEILEKIAAANYIANDNEGFQKTISELAALPDAPPWAADMRASVTAANAGDMKTALASAEKAIAADAKQIFIYTYAIDLAWKTGDIPAADRIAPRILAVNPRDHFANYVRATVLSRDKKYADAEKHYIISIAANPAWFVLNDFAAMLTDTGKIEPALAIAAQALKNGGDAFAAVWDTYGTLLLKTGKRAEAKKAFETAVAKPGGDDPRIQLNLAEMALEDGDKATAQKALPLIDKNKDQLSVEERERLGRIRSKLR